MCVRSNASTGEAIRWTQKNADGTVMVMPNPTANDPKQIGAAKNYLRKHSRKINDIFERAGL